MELYSKRKRAAEEPPTACRYDLPDGFKRQVWHIWNDSIGYLQEVPVASIIDHDRYDLRREDAILSLYARINKFLCEEHGKTSLPGSSTCHALYLWFMEADTDTALDIIEGTFAGIQIGQKDRNFVQLMGPSIKLSFSEAVAKLNRRFMEHAVGYRYEQGRIVRIDSDFLHAEAVEPAMRLMHTQGYKGALEEFLLAQKYYRQGADHYDDCLTNYLKAVESTLQKIIELRQWQMPGEAKFDNLFTEVRKKGLFPPFLGSHLGELKKFLQTVAVIRNEEGAHGAGSVPNEVPDHLVAYQIHLTGSAIVFLIRSNDEYGRRKS